MPRRIDKLSCRIVRGAALHGTLLSEIVMRQMLSSTYYREISRRNMIEWKKYPEQGTAGRLSGFPGAYTVTCRLNCNKLLGSLSTLDSVPGRCLGCVKLCASFFTWYSCALATTRVTRNIEMFAGEICLAVLGSEGYDTTEPNKGGFPFLPAPPLCMQTSV